jgi:hypothetical protein
VAILYQFLLRLAFGLTVAMALTSPRWVTSGFYRNHLYVALGLTTLAGLVGLSAAITWWPALAAAVISYLGAVCWLYEKKTAGVATLWLVAGFSVIGCWLAPELVPGSTTGSQSSLIELARSISATTSGLVLGLTTAAMLLGHWYLNTPSMQLLPLRRLLVFSALAVGTHAVICAAGLTSQIVTVNDFTVTDWLLVVLRWSFGLIGTTILIAMAWQTLRIPNTQSATGILYVGVIAVFTGELAGLLLSAQSPFPL